MAHQHQQSEGQENANAKFLLDALYCSEEEHLEDESYISFHHDFENVEESYLTNNASRINPLPMLLEQDLFWDDEELKSLLAREQKNQLYKCLESNLDLAGAWKEAVLWMLKVNAHYSFSALTAVLAVDYFDRFLFSFQFQSGKPWMTQLAAVACLSLAAKVEETHVPPLLDLQGEDSRYVFEAKTIKRMEILVLSTLGWKMNPVTPLSFLDYIARRLGLKDYLCWEFLRRCEGILISVIADSKFMCYLPSVLATATMIYIVDSVDVRLGVEYQNQFLGILAIDKDEVDECYKLILEMASGRHNTSKQSKKRKLGSIPRSPNGVMEVSFSCDSSNESWAVAASVSSSPEPLSKKSRSQQQLLLNHPNSDFLSIPR